MANRISTTRALLQDYGADALLISAIPNIRWACGFTGSNALLLVRPDSAVFVTDGRYTDQAQQEVEGAEVLVAHDGLITNLGEEGYLDGLESVVIQADDVTVAKRDGLVDAYPDIEWISESGVLKHAVARKDSEEVDRIRRAQQLTEAVFDHILSTLEPGLTEREVAAEITYQHLKRGADEMSFDPIVASGPNAARPHARPTDRKLQSGELVVLDMGGVMEGYASDMTRTVAIGDPGDRAREGYQLVREAQERALSEARSGIQGKELDAFARGYLKEAGLGKHFAHGLGHGIGLEVHEWPRVSYAVEEELPERACVTIEPGIYLPSEGYGVRIEDIVVLYPDGYENLTSTSKDLIQI